MFKADKPVLKISTGYSGDIRLDLPLNAFPTNTILGYAYRLKIAIPYKILAGNGVQTKRRLSSDVGDVNMANLTSTSWTAYYTTIDIPAGATSVTLKMSIETGDSILIDGIAVSYVSSPLPSTSNSLTKIYGVNDSTGLVLTARYGILTAMVQSGDATNFWVTNNRSSSITIEHDGVGTKYPQITLIPPVVKRYY